MTWGYVGFHNLDLPLYDYYGLVWRAPLGRTGPALLPRPDGPWLASVLAALNPDLVALESPKAPATAPPGYRYVPIPGDSGRSGLIRDL